MAETTKRVQTVLLSCGVLASLLYLGTDLLAGLLWEGYSFVHQAVSELSAVDAPTRPLTFSLYLVYDVLLIAFGWGIWRSADPKRPLRITGGALIGIGVVGFIGIPFPLHLGVAEAAFMNTMHTLIAGVIAILFMLAIGFGAIILGKRFRFYSIGTLLLTIINGGVLGLMAGPRIVEEGFTMPPQWFGLSERISIYGSMLWIMVLAIVLLRMEKRSGLVSSAR